MSDAPDLQQAIHAAQAEMAVLRHSNSLMRDLTREQDMALTDTRGQLQAAQAENQQLRDLLQEIHDSDVLADAYDAVTDVTWLAQLQLKVSAALEHHAALGQVDQ